ncbi:MAG: ComEC family competence protein [Rikenellaceae bacterium]|nr:ComEC family competence protein [Rikenellaceae bacterium]
MAPLVKLLVPAGFGILFHRLTGVGWEYSAVCLAVSWAAAWYFADRRAGGGAGPYPWLAVFFLFAWACSFFPLRDPGIPDGEYIRAEAVISESAAEGRWRQAVGTVTAYRTSAGDGWRKARFGVQLYLDSTYTARAGQRILVKGYFNRFHPADGSYGALMTRRGTYGRMYITEGSLLGAGDTRTGFISGIHLFAVQKSSRLPGDRDKVAVASAMVSGQRRTIPREVREDYRNGGGAHLLAVSGLHVGIVFVLVNLMLWFVPLFRKGHIIRNLLAVCLIWLFAAAAGLSPSIQRAALMFSFMQFSLARGTRRHALNGLAASAFIMLALDPDLAGDPGFVLSYTAVLAILLYFGPLYSLVKTRSRIVNALAGIYIVGMVASLAVAPFVSYWFGRIPLAGIAVNPAVILTAHVIVAAGVVWLVWPFPFGGEVFGMTAQWAVTAQNGIMTWCASLDGAAVEVRLPLWAAVGIYCGIVLLSVPLARYCALRREKVLDSLG